MAVECFLKFEGPDLKGESKADGYAEQVDVLAWSWGATQTGTMHVATGGGRQGRCQRQVWEVRISSVQEKLVCISRVTMAVLNTANQY